MPIGSLATDGQLHGLISSLDGMCVVRGRTALDVTDPESSGRALANELRRDGGDEVLAGLRRADRIPAPQPE